MDRSDVEFRTEVVGLAIKFAMVKALACWKANPAPAKQKARGLRWIAAGDNSFANYLIANKAVRLWRADKIATAFGNSGGF